MNPLEILKKPITTLDPALFKANTQDNQVPAVKAPTALSLLSKPLPTEVTARLFPATRNASDRPTPFMPRDPVSIMSKPLPSSITGLLKGPKITEMAGKVSTESERKVRPATWRDVANLPTEIIGGALKLADVISPLLSLRQAVTGKEGKFQVSNPFPNEGKYPVDGPAPEWFKQQIESQEKQTLHPQVVYGAWQDYVERHNRNVEHPYSSETSQRYYVDQLDAGVDQKQAFWNTALKTVLDMSILVPVVRDAGKLAVLRTAPQTLVDTSLQKATREELRRFVSGAAEYQGQSMLPKELQDAFKALPDEEKVIALKNSGIELATAKPSALGRLLGITDNEAQALIGERVRQGSAGELPGYVRDEPVPAFGLSTEKRKAVGFGEKKPPVPPAKFKVTDERVIEGGDGFNNWKQIEYRNKTGDEIVGSVGRVNNGEKLPDNYTVRLSDGKYLTKPSEVSPGQKQVIHFSSLKEAQSAIQDHYSKAVKESEGVKEEVRETGVLDDGKEGPGRPKPVKFSDEGLRVSTKDIEARISRREARKQARLTDKEKRALAGNLEKANREYLAVVRKEMEEGLPKSKVEREILIDEARLADEYRKAGKLDEQFYKVEQVFSEVETIMAEARPGERVFTGYGSDAEVRGVESSFPKWVPEHLRSRELFDSVQASLDINGISMPSGKRQQELFNVVFDRADEILGVNTKELRQELAEKVRRLPASKVLERDQKALERLMNRQAKETKKAISEEDKKKELMRNVERRDAYLKLEAERTRVREQKIAEARLDALKEKKFLKALKDRLFPTRSVDPETQGHLEDWVSLRFSAKEAGNEMYHELYKRGPQTLQEIIAYESGKPIDYIKENLDEMGTLAKRVGIEFGFRENYLPHIYMEKRDQVMEAIGRYLKREKNMTDEEVKDYLAGKELAQDKSRRLKLNPFFSKDRVFPTYSIAIKYGLTPKYTQPARLVAHYKEELETVLANNKLLADLKASAKLLNELEAPDTWVPVTRRFSPNVLYADPQLARVLNDVFSDEQNLDLFSRGVRVLGGISRFMQELKLSAGVPFTNINYFSTGQAVRLLTTAVGEMAMGQFRGALSTLKSSFAYIRANSNKASARWFYDNREYIARMALEGIDISGRIGNFKFQSLREAFGEVLLKGKAYPEITGKELAKKKAVLVKDMLGVTFSKAFNEKTFGSMMSQVAVQMFKDGYENALRKGMSDPAASKFAADLVRNITGISKENLRGQTVQDSLAAGFFAPKFREGVMNIVYNSIKAFGKKNWKDASFAKNRAFFLGAAITFALYQMINLKTSGQFTWQNPAGREFAIRKELPNGQVMYIEFLPSFMAFIRNMASGTIALGTGDFELATQKYGTAFSMPAKLATEIISNSDYFGREIYKDTDSAGKKLKKIAAYVGLGTSHPFITESWRYARGDEPLYQAVSYMLEAPVKYSTLDKENKSAYYNMLDDQNKKRAEVKEKVRPIYEKNQELIAQGKKAEAVKIYNNLSPLDRKIYDQVKKDEKAKQTTERKPFINSVYEKNQELIREGRRAEAVKIYRDLSPRDRKIYDAIKKSRELFNDI